MDGTVRSQKKGLSLVKEREVAVPPLDSPEKRAHFVQSLLSWYAIQKRDLPFRKTRDPYAIWVSETMLQQTQVATVLPYWTRWMDRFPTVSDLASAPLEDILKQWQGLGYYARARNLHRAAQVVAERHGGVFPSQYEDLLALPGVGRYTAGAVGSIALGLDVPIVDANVIRVLCRVFGVTGDPKSTAVQARLWMLAEELIPSGQASDFNQGMMELGALVCTAKPACGRCPAHEICTAFATGKTESLPEFAPRPEFTHQTDISAVLTHPDSPDSLLLVRRPEGGLWGGLWELPRVTATDEESPADAAVRAARETVGLEVEVTGGVVGQVRHGVTTRKITLLALPCRLTGSVEVQPAPGFSYAWVPRSEVHDFALSSPQAKLLKAVIGATGGAGTALQPTLF